MTKIGDRFIVDISKNFTFSGMFVWSLPEPSVSVFTILNCREPSLSVLHDRINNPLAFFTILSRTIGWRSSRLRLSRTIRWRYFTIRGLKNHSLVLLRLYIHDWIRQGSNTPGTFWSKNHKNNIALREVRSSPIAFKI